MENQHDWVKLFFVTSSYVSWGLNLLPKADVLFYYPKLQRVYQTLIWFLAACGGNIRYRLPSLDVSFPFLKMTKPAGAQPPPTVEELQESTGIKNPVVVAEKILVCSECRHDDPEHEGWCSRASKKPEGVT